MKSSRFVSVAAAAFLALSTVTAGAGNLATPPTGHTNPTAVWVIFGCAGGIILAALDANWRQHRQLTAYEAATCGIAYWFTVTNPR